MIVIDTSAIMAMLLGEDKATEVIQCLSDNEACISAGTMSELIIVATARGLLREAEAVLEATGIEIAPVSGSTAKRVQEAYEKWGKGRHKASLNFGDCFAYALADQRDIPLLFIGNDFTHTDLRSAL